MQAMIENGKYYTVEEAAAELGITVGRVRQMLNVNPKDKKQKHKSRLTGIKFGKSWAISQEELDKAKEIDRRAGNPNFFLKSC